MAKADGDPQAYRDWLMAKGMVEWINDAAAARAQREGLPAPEPKPLPPPPKGSWDYLEARGKTWVQLRAKEQATAERKAQAEAKRAAKKQRVAA